MIKKLIFILMLAPAIGAVAQTSPTSLGFTGLNHIALHVKDMPASKNFYQNIMGLAPIEVPDSLKAIRGWFNTGNGQMIHLLAGRTEPVVNDKNGGHYAIFVQSIANAEQFLTAKKIPFHKQVRFGGVVQIYFADPDGYLIEMNEKK
ncbi:VOC family protein [Dyadobacter sandarakinus]|uniref:VOC family protein n=1 Tax=Dyadobacter sandarakinus TaxID=2747268 RepID=A0ABX7I6W0_9BACT|nr:VOC family protein [Dyadobacter sandarakinus]QRR01634.1 VOC family protein [Dyadobacter sandarakinus]